METLEKQQALEVKELTLRNLQSSKLFPELADWCSINESQAWSSPREMEGSNQGSYPHGMLDVIEGEGWARIWCDKRQPDQGIYCGWYNTHNGLGLVAK